MPRKDPKKYLIRQANTMSFSRHNLNLIQKRIVYLVVSKIKPDDKDFREYTFTVQEVLKFIKLGTENHSVLHKTTEDILKKVCTLVTPEGELLQFNYFSLVKYNPTNTEVTFHFDPVLKPYYLELKNNYTQFQLEIVIGLKSIYSQKLYEIAKSIANKGDPSIRYSISEWRYLLFIDDNEYKLYAHLKANVFQIAQRELDEKTDIHIEFKEEKSGNKVKWLWMEVHKIENEEQRQAWIRQTKFNQLPKRVRESLLQSSGATEKSSLSDIAVNVEARKKAIAEAEEMGLFDKKPDIAVLNNEEANEE